MAIVPLKKITVYGTSERKPDVLDELQRMGCLHLIGLCPEEDHSPQVVSKVAREALAYLDSCGTIRRKSSSGTQYDRQKVIQQTLEVKSEAERLENEHDHLKKAIEDVSVWGEFALQNVEEECEQQLWFYEIPLHDLDVLTDEMLWYVARRDNRFAYVVVLAANEPNNIGYPAVNLDRRPLSELKTRVDAVEEELDDLHWRRVGLTRWRKLLKNDLDAADDVAARDAAATGAMDDETVFAVQAYAPEVACDDLLKFAEREDVAVTFEPIATEEAAPTLLHNPKRVAGAEDCVTFYMTPGYHSWDPTSVVYFSFSLFFAMIVADAGYAMVMAIGLTLFWRRLSESESTIGFRNLLLGIVLATSIYGVLVGSYFGVEPAPGSLLDRLRVRIDGKPMMTNQTGMMLIAVAIGVAHLVLANLVSAWNSRGKTRWLGHLGWAMVMIGAFLIGGGAMAEIASLGTVGKTLAVSGAVAILLFSSDRPWSLSVKGILMRMLDGVMQFANLSKAFGDVLSYLRLFALGLASAQLAITFNGLAHDASQAGGIGLLAAMLILVVGHTINFMLGILGGVVHGLRLNCIEFFNWSLTDEGYSFQPFTKKSED